MPKILKKSLEIKTKINPEDSIILGIDQSLNGSAFVWMKNFKVLDFRFFTDTLSKSKNPHAVFNKETGSKRLNNIFNFLQEKLKEYELTNAAIEDYAFGAKSQSVFQLGGLGEMMKLCLYRSGVPYRTYEPNKVKKFATGNGSAEKSEIVLAAYKDGFDVGHFGKNGEDLADAYWIAKMLTIELFLHRNNDYLENLNQKQKEVFSDITKAYPIPLINRPFYS